MCNFLVLKMIKSKINSIMHLWHFHDKSKTITAAHIKNAISFVDYRKNVTQMSRQRRIRKRKKKLKKISEKN